MANVVCLWDGLRGPAVQGRRAVTPNQTIEVDLKLLKRHALYQNFFILNVSDIQEANESH